MFLLIIKSNWSILDYKYNFNLVVCLWLPLLSLFKSLILITQSLFSACHLKVKELLKNFTFIIKQNDLTRTGQHWAWSFNIKRPSGDIISKIKFEMWVLEFLSQLKLFYVFNSQDSKFSTVVVDSLDIICYDN